MSASRQASMKENEAFPTENEVSVAELAADRVRRNRFPALPIWVLILLLMTASIAGIVVPMALIFAWNSNASLNDVTTIAIQLAATEASQGVRGAIASTTQILDALMASPYFSKDFMTHVADIKSSAGVIPAMMTGVRTFDYISALVCSTPGSTAVGPYGPYTNRTNVQAVYASMAPGGPKQPMVILQDQTTGASVTVNLLSPDYGAVLTSINIGPARLSNGGDVLLANQLSSTPAVEPFFDITYLNATGTAFWQISYYRNHWVDKTKAGTTVPDFGCSIGFQIDASLTVYLNSMRVTNNTILMLMDTSGLLLSTNRPDSIASSTNATVRVTPDASPVTAISLVGRALLSTYGSYSSLPTSNASTVLQQRFADGTEWFLSTTSLTVSGDQLTFVVAIPRSDLFAQMDAGERRGVIVASAVACLGLIITGLMTFFALRPLQRMATSMRKLTKFDFSFLENGVLNKRSPLKEIREVETVFDMMVKAFAGAIRRNKTLMGGQTGQGGSSKSGAASSVVW